MATIVDVCELAEKLKDSVRTWGLPEQSLFVTEAGAARVCWAIDAVVRDAEYLAKARTPELEAVLQLFVEELESFRPAIEQMLREAADSVAMAQNVEWSFLEQVRTFLHPAPFPLQTPKSVELAN